MKRSKITSTILILTFVVSIFATIDLVSATSREDLLAEFCLANQDISGGFLDTPEGSAADLTEFTTFANTFILSQVDPEMSFFEGSDKANLGEWFSDKFNAFTSFDSKQIMKATYAYNGLLLVDPTGNSTQKDLGISTMIELQNETTYGFAGHGTNGFATMSDTYYAVLFLSLTESLSLLDAELVSSFVISCWNSEEHAFAGSPNSIQSNLADSFYAISTLELLNSTSVLNITTQQFLSDYVESYYVSEPAYESHFGGYSYPESVVMSSLMLTYYSLSIQDALGGPLHEETVDWVLSRQNPVDYGFSDYSPNLHNVASSAKLSYFAVKSILTFDVDAFNTGGVFAKNVWDLSTNGWIIAAIWAGILGLMAIAGILIYKYKNRI
ncbi:MAG: prenyltransferase/squalene oxidase repeat-containing protein [Promethearchaeota archaeon]